MNAIRCASKLSLHGTAPQAVQHTRTRCVAQAAHLVSRSQRSPALGPDRVLACLARRQLRTLDLAYTLVTDVSALAACTSLQELYLGCCNVTDVSSVLVACTSLHALFLSFCGNVTDVSALAACTGLKRLNLTETGVTDVSALAACTGLQKLNLYKTGVTDVSSVLAWDDLTNLRLEAGYSHHCAGHRR
mgnify:CR=1 FL=1